MKAIQLSNLPAKRGRIVRVINTQPRLKAAETYLFLSVEDEDGKRVELFFTDAEIKRAKIRRERNPEDAPRIRSWLYRFFNS